MALKLDPFVQRKLLDLAAADQAISAATHRRSTLPELLTISQGTERATASRRAVIAAETEVSDLKRATNKLDSEVDQVRARAKRDADRLASGAASPKELENLQHEIESLKRRQSTLEDEELELMEQRERAEEVLAAARATLAEIDATIGTAEARRDELFAEIDQVLDGEQEKRAALVPQFPADVMALYSRIKDSGKVAAGELRGARCGACRLEIDRMELARIRSAPIDAIARCSECGAILIRA